VTNEQAQENKFEGWAILEIFGHQRYAGFVSTQVFGTAAMFRIDVPALEEREEILKRPQYGGGQYLPPGTKVKLGGVQGYTKLFGVGAIYAMTPCTEAAALKAVEAMQERPMMVIDIPDATRALPEGGQAAAIDAVCPATGIAREECECPACGDDGEEER